MDHGFDDSPTLYIGNEWLFHQTSILKNNCLGYQDDIEFPMGNFSHQPPNRLLGQGVEDLNAMVALVHNEEVSGCVEILKKT